MKFSQVKVEWGVSKREGEKWTKRVGGKGQVRFGNGMD